MWGPKLAWTKHKKLQKSRVPLVWGRSWRGDFSMLTHHAMLMGSNILSQLYLPIEEFWSKSKWR